MTVSLFTLLVVLLVGGAGLGLLNASSVFDPQVKRVINVLVMVVLVVVTLVWLLGFLGVNVGQPRLR